MVVRSCLHYENMTYVQVHKAYKDILDILSGTHTHTHTHTLRPFYQCSAVDGPGSNLGPLCYLEDKAFNDYKQIKLLLTV